MRQREPTLNTIKMHWKNSIKNYVLTALGTVRLFSLAKMQRKKAKGIE